MPLEEEIKKDVRKWSEHFLEIPNKHLGGFPACPFAKKTWKDNKVVIEVKRKNKWYNKKDIYFMGFHPHNPANEEEQEFLVTPNGDTPTVESDMEYSMMLAQKFSQLQEASDKLHRIGYYDKWPSGYYKDVVVSRAKTYKRIFGGQYDG
jgi:hypothetical protein